VPPTRTLPTPDVVGRDVVDAVALVLASSLFPDLVPVDDPLTSPGRVRAQTPEGRETVRGGASVRLEVRASSGDVEVPPVLGLPRDEAVARVEAAGLRAEVRRVHGPWMPPSHGGRVVVQWPLDRASGDGPVRLWVASR
jgi:beta-lactam-binding protein with PASTA domain